jgi:hypothetical protein
MRQRLSLFVGIFLLLAGGPAFGGDAQDDSSPVARAERYCNHIADLSKSSKKYVFADVATGKMPEWKRFTDVASLEKVLRNQAPTAVAFVWFHQGKLVQANFTFQSESNDWAKYTNHCFRPDGSLAVVRSTLKTFHGNATQVVTSIYDPAGSPVKTKTEYFDLNTGNAIQSPGYFQDEQTVHYVKVGDLPFIALIGAKK